MLACLLVERPLSTGGCGCQQVAVDMFDAVDVGGAGGVECLNVVESD